MLGSPIAHSRSPQLHLAAYRALGLHDWTYERIECGAAELPVVVGGFGPEWVGVSVTMPGKFAALRFADERTARADLVGSANTLVRTPHGWRAALSELRATTVMSVTPSSASPTTAAAEVLVSTIPAEVAAGYAGTLAAIPVLLDAIYDPWPTPLAAAVGSAGGRVISGLQMLLHQAFAQVEQFTGLPAPREAMTCALAALD